MNKLISILTAAAMSAALEGISGCGLIDGTADNDAWKNNIGTVNLTDMTAVGDGVTINGTDVIFSQGGDYEITGTLAEGQLVVDSTEKVKLRLSGANITNPNGAAIYIKNADKAFITLTEGTENTLTDGETYTSGDENEKACITSRDNLEIKGHGSLTVNGNYNHGIDSADAIEIVNGNITVSAKNDGITANDEILISGGGITISADDKGITAGGDIVIDDGDIVVKKCTEGIESAHYMTINGGNIDITASDDGLNAGGTGMGKGNMPQMPDGERPERGDMPQMPNGERPERGDMPQMPDGGFGRNTETDEQDGEHHIQINGGTITITADNDGIDSNGSLFIEGGMITVNAQAAGAESAFDTDGAMLINGGTVVGISGTGMDESPNSYSKQNTILCYTASNVKSGERVTVTNAEGETLFDVTAAKGGNKIVLSSDKLKTGEEYTIKTASEELTAKLEGTITTVGERRAGFGGRGGFKPERNGQ